MSRRAIFVAVAVIALAVAVWKSQLFTVSSRTLEPRPLAAIDPNRRTAVTYDVVLPVVPVGLRRMKSDDGVTIVHYWAPWGTDALDQAMRLDSLRSAPGMDAAAIVLVTFEPFPSVARYVARHRLGIPVLLDGHRELRGALPCPSLPYTYVVDAGGRIAVAQDGPIDWTHATTRRVLNELMRSSRNTGVQPGTTEPST